jgi:valyl-tRNA synthetase
LEYTRGFLFQVNQKLGNEKFVANAKPELVEKEQQKKADAEAKIMALEKVLG